MALSSVVLSSVLVLACLAAAASAAADSCYINDSGFTCCDKNLEAAMKSAMSGRDLLASADDIQRKAERSLGGKFETVVALDDFAYKSHFKEGKTCKIERNGQYALAWQP
ncbi:grd-5 [Pristionchus pacificus]|uniref:Grd-5 n=1 Tax=Pristionchus pacificus TaxID=54126 RepID=A0A2A6C1K8_PRIPA|nr:grd-5 [Pristionchus pacificus]|eukprot:PDM72054.1 grd-5 [Pristionchus pacificus]